MPQRILIVDDNMSLRSTLSIILSTLGYEVRSAVDGFSALNEIRQRLPDVLLSDLNMPGMSGFELLSVVRRRFPQVLVIAMSGAFSEDAVPPNVPADGFYRKGTGVESLLRMLGGLEDVIRSPARQSEAPIWVSRHTINPCGDGHVVISCPECLRVFPQPVPDSGFSSAEVRCVHCAGVVRFALVQAAMETDLTGIFAAVS
jgi:CheY-like chemotaxis protein